MEAGDRIDGWVVEARLGSGGMGSVYRCRNASTERIVAALKVLDRSLRSSPEASTRFVREAEILAGLDHPNIVRVRNVRVDADPPYLEMEFVEGEALDAVIRRGPAGYGRARHLLLQLADAVAYLHARGVRHRDLKPANVLVDPSDRVRLVDFGLATETSLERITEEGLNFGTVSYAPPEWMDPERLDPVQWDLYALGVVFHELLTGSIAYPMSGEGAVKKQLLQVMMNKQVAPPLDPGPTFPDAVRRLVGDLTRIDPAERPQTAADVRARLLALPDVAPGADGATAPPAASRAPGPQSLVVTLPPRGPRGWLLPAAVLLALGAAAATAVVLVPWGATPQGEVRPPPPDPLPPPTARRVALEFVGVPAGWPIRVALGGDSVVADGAIATFPAASTAAQAASWVVGAGCDGCPDGSCPAWCGTGKVPVEAGTGAASLVVPVSAGVGDVFIDVPALLREGAKARRKRKWELSGRLGGRTVTSDAASLRFPGVPAGRHEVVVDVGECPPAAAGCWPGGECPDRCRSDVVEVVVPFGGGDVHLRSEVPTP